MLTWKQQWICAICPWICDQESFHISQVIVSASTEYFTSISIGYRAWALCFHYKFFNHKEFFPILTSCCATGYASSSSRAPSRKCCTSFTPLPLLFLTIFLSSFCSRDSLLIFLLWKFLCTVQVRLLRVERGGAHVRGGPGHRTLTRSSRSCPEVILGGGTEIATVFWPFNF